MKGYQTSKDYKRLKELLDKGYDIVCWADYERYDGHVCRDICHARKMDDTYIISARGIEYGSYWDGRIAYDSFEEMCEDNHIEFIEPTGKN